ncbi:phospholipid-binding protein MlaC [Magnetospirillum sp. SS-4]|uniref:MlaC/ttg2D family ABC transporter substrate-binding protein n=1 Tax=Magnetospirillum sp. SS-4 TaxID=2681465 RepID=UPI0013859357|nr:ABC transporter substrate-binding protein [Magnetospirillum sp. SS-4]CAA7626105.1 ABC-type transport system involved in resistance to organic solvents, auxiliary component [Magnetospirillum sp. SS-4]
MGYRSLRVAVFVVLGLLLASPARALEAAAAEAVVRSAVADASAAFEGGPFSRDEKRARVSRLVEKYVDLPFESELLLGRHWRKASPEQRSTFTELLIPFFVSTYGSMVDSAKVTPEVEVIGSQPGGGGAVVVHTLLKTPGETPVTVDWTVTGLETGRTVITDLVAQDIGLVTTLKADFTAVIRSAGGDIEALFAAMRKKITG